MPELLVFRSCFDVHIPYLRSVSPMAMSNYYLCDKCGCKVQYDADIEWRYGDCAMICEECAKTYKCVIVPINDSEAPPQ